MRKEIRGAAKAEIARCAERLSDAIADENKEIERLAEQATGEPKKLTKEVNQFAKKPPS